MDRRMDRFRLGALPTERRFLRQIWRLAGLALLSACAAAGGPVADAGTPEAPVAAATPAMAASAELPAAWPSPAPGQLAQAAQAAVPSAAPSALPASFPVMTFNLNAYNTDVDVIRTAVLASGAAVVALQEYRPASHAGLLDQLRTRYPYQITCLRRVVVLSGFPARDQGCVEIGDTEARDIAWMLVDGPGGPWTFASVHFSRPSFATGLGQLLGSEDGAEEQAAQFDQLGSFVFDRERDSTVVVMGDFNAEAGWPHFAAFLDRTGLATGEDPPSTRSVGGIGFAIDNVLAGPGATVATLMAGPDAGSDHLPLTARIDVTAGR